MISELDPLNSVFITIIFETHLANTWVVTKMYLTGTGVEMYLFLTYDLHIIKIPRWRRNVAGIRVAYEYNTSSWFDHGVFHQTSNIVRSLLRDRLWEEISNLNKHANNSINTNIPTLITSSTKTSTFIISNSVQWKRGQFVMSWWPYNFMQVDYMLWNDCNNLLYLSNTNKDSPQFHDTGLLRSKWWHHFNDNALSPSGSPLICKMNLKGVRRRNCCDDTPL